MWMGAAAGSTNGFTVAGGLGGALSHSLSFQPAPHAITKPLAAPRAGGGAAPAGGPGADGEIHYFLQLEPEDPADAGRTVQIAVDVVEGAMSRFIRGDFNADRRIDIADAVRRYCAATADCGLNGVCVVPGLSTAPNQCDGGPTDCAAGGTPGPNDGQCQSGPTDLFCEPNGTMIGCMTNDERTAALVASDPVLSSRAISAPSVMSTSVLVSSACAGVGKPMANPERSSSITASSTARCACPRMTVP